MLPTPGNQTGAGGTDRVRPARRRKRLIVRLFDEQHADVLAIAKEHRLSVTALVRQAIDAFVMDSRDVPVFDRRRDVQPVSEERRASPGRRAYDQDPPGGVKSSAETP